MMNEKYEMFGDSNENGQRRIRALRDFGDVRKGDVGGWIGSESNLSQEGNCWVSGDASVFDSALIFENALVFENAHIFGASELSGNSRVSGNAKVFGQARVSESAQISGNAQIYEYAKIFGRVWISDDSEISGDAWISDIIENVTISPKSSCPCCGQQVMPSISMDALRASALEKLKLTLTLPERQALGIE